MSFQGRAIPGIHEHDRIVAQVGGLGMQSVRWRGITLWCLAGLLSLRGHDST